MTQRDKRTLRLAGLALAVYLALFYGGIGWKRLETKRLAYAQLVLDAQRFKLELQRYENKVLQVDKLKATYRIDPPKLPKASLVAEASSAIQKAAMTGGVQLGPIRESPPRPSAKELATMQLEGMGQAQAILALLHRLQTLGYPLVFDTVQINTDPTKPGMVKLNLTIVILDYEQWKTKEQS